MASTIDLRSDTVTLPTKAMMQAAAACKMGDDVMQEDPTVNELEALAADMLGMEAALLVPSGTFANQCAILTHSKSADEILVSEDSHIVQHEAGASALLSRVQTRIIAPQNGQTITATELRRRLRLDEDIHYPDSGLVCLEQATAWGDVYEISELESIHSLCQSAGVPIHVDGARFFNAAIALGCTPAEMAAFCDSVCFCLSKGLCAPVGSLLCGNETFIFRARKNRKILGGGMRQAGIIAAPGLIALNEMIERLTEDHENAKLLADGLGGIEGVHILRQPKVNMLFASIDHPNKDGVQFVQALAEHGLLTYPPEAGLYRFVTHHGIEKQDIAAAVSIIADTLAKA